MNIPRAFFWAARGALALALLLCLQLGCKPTNEGCNLCSYGQEKCSTDKQGIMICKQIFATGCWQFTLKRCDPGQVCAKESLGGRHVCQVEHQNCTDKCTVGVKQCEGETVVHCKVDAATGCPQWFAEITCQAGNRCQNGICGGQPCNKTNPQHEKKCVGQAVHWFDNCGGQGAQIEICQPPQTCQNGACAGSGPCTPKNPQHEKKCAGQSVHWYDDCGTIGAQVEICQPPQTCQNGACVGGGPCTPKNPQHEKKCEGNDLYWYDDCGKKGDLAENCTHGCKDGKCQNNGGCTPKDDMYSKKCVGNQVYWFDDCGNQKTLIETCEASKKCQGGVCVEAGCSGGTNQCNAADSQCQGNAVQLCNKNPTTGCFEWGTPVPCASGQVCQNGSCTNGQSGGNACKVGAGGICKSDSECCKGQSCQDIIPGVLSLCGPCTTDADCPTDGSGIRMKCCKQQHCAAICL